MTSKRSFSPGPIDLMKEIMKLIAEPNSINNKKKTEVNGCAQRSSKIINHDYCDECLEGGEIIHCDKCPKSYHIKCHIPTINKLPDGKWFCKRCTYIENDNFDHEVPRNGCCGKIVKEYACNYNSTDQDTFKMDMMPSLVNKIENCDTSKCKVFRNFNASLKKIMELENPYYLVQEFLSEIPIQRKYNVKLPARKQLDKQKMIRKNDRCFICKRGILRGRLVQCHYCCRLYHLNCLDPPIRDWDHSMRWICPEHNKFYELAYPDYFTPNCRSVSDNVTMKRKRCEIPKLPINTFFNIPSYIDAMYKKPEEKFPITSTGNSSLNILCDVASFELESINSNQQTNKDNIVTNDITDKFLVHECLNKIQEENCFSPKQLTVSLSCLSVPIKINIYNSLTIGKGPNNNLCLLLCGNCEYVSDLHATITYNEKLGDYLINNHSRYGIIVDNVSYFGRHRPKDLSNSKWKRLNYQVKKFINKRRKYLYKNKLFRFYQKNESGKLIIKYITKRRKFNYRSMFKIFKYNSSFKNTNYNYRQIECKCSNRLIPKDGYAEQAVLHNGSIILIGCIKFIFSYDSHIKENSKICTEELVSKHDGPVENKSHDSHLKSQYEQENSVTINKDTESETEFVIINDYPLEDVEDTNYFNEQNNISTFDLNNFNDHNFSNDDNTIDCVSENVIIHNKVKPVSDINLSSLSNINWDNTNETVSDTIQSCFGEDSVHDVEIINPSEENLYSMNYIDAENSTAVGICNVDRWLLQGVIINENNQKIDIKPLTGSYSIQDHNIGDSRTEHLESDISSNGHANINVSDSDTMTIVTDII